MPVRAGAVRHWLTRRVSSSDSGSQSTGWAPRQSTSRDPGTSAICTRSRQAEVAAPPGFEDAIGWVAPTEADEPPHWHVTFAVADRDQATAAATRLGGQVLGQRDTEWTRDALIKDPQGAVFTASQFTPPTG